MVYNPCHRVKHFLTSGLKVRYVALYSFSICVILKADGWQNETVHLCLVCKYTATTQAAHGELLCLLSDFASFCCSICCPSFRRCVSAVMMQPSECNHRFNNFGVKALELQNSHANSHDNMLLASQVGQMLICLEFDCCNKLRHLSCNSRTAASVIIKWQTPSIRLAVD